MYHFSVEQTVEILSKHGKLPEGPNSFYIALISTNRDLRAMLDKQANDLENDYDYYMDDIPF